MVCLASAGEVAVLNDVVIIDDQVVSRAQVLGNGDRAASGFHAAGLSEGQSIALLLRNDIAFFEASRGAALLGAASVPLNWHNKPYELEYVLGDSVPRAIVGHADLLRAARDVLPANAAIFVVPEPETDLRAARDAVRLIPGARLWPEWLTQFSPWTEPPRPIRGATIYTSGTTGRPKAVRKPPMSPDLSSSFQAAIRLISGITPSSRVLILGPLYHASPEAYGKAAVNGAQLAAFQSRFDPEGVLQLISEHRITHAVMVPTMFVRLLQLPAKIRERYDVSSLQGVLHTGGPCPVQVKRDMIAWWGPVINEIYGATESGPCFFCTSSEALAHPGTVGRLMQNAVCRIVDENSDEVPPSTPGEIYLRNTDFGDFEYVGHPDQRRAVERDGLITIGDVGYLDAEGYLYLCDRKRDMVISGGVNIYPAEIEAVLIGHADVGDCAVFGVPHAEFGEQLIAAVALKPGHYATGDKLRSFLAERLSNYKLPRVIEFHDHMPREETGKLFKRRLRDAYLKRDQGDQPTRPSVANGRSNAVGSNS